MKKSVFYDIISMNSKVALTKEVKIIIMMRIPNDFYIQCDKCNHVSLIETDGLDYETSVYDRPMGDEIEYTFHGEICCEKCHSWIEFCIRGYEYPILWSYRRARCERIG